LHNRHVSEARDAPEGRLHDYVRHGTVGLRTGPSLTGGPVTEQVSSRQRAVEFKKFFDALIMAVVACLEVQVLSGNSSTRQTPAVHGWLLKHLRVHSHVHTAVVILDGPRLALAPRDYP
jgi:hypothetical protein